MQIRSENSSDSDHTEEEVKELKPSESGPLKVLHGQAMDRFHDQINKFETKIGQFFGCASS